MKYIDIILKSKENALKKINESLTLMASVAIEESYTLHTPDSKTGQKEGTINVLKMAGHHIEKKLGLPDNFFDKNEKYSDSRIVKDKGGNKHSIYSSYGQVRIRPHSTNSDPEATEKLKKFLGEEVSTELFEFSIEDENEYIFIDSFDGIEELTEEQLDEAEKAGNLKGLTSHLLKVVAGKGAGQNSEVEDSGKLKSHAALKSHLNKVMLAGHTAVVHVDGKPVAAIAHANNYGGRQEYEHHTDKGRPSEQKTSFPSQASARRGAKPYTYDDTRPLHNKGDVLNKMHQHLSDDDFKTKHVSVKSVALDKDRAKKHAERQANKPGVQTNYSGADPKNPKHAAKIKTGNGAYRRDGGGHTVQTSTTSAGDNLKSVKDAAALRVADKKVPQGSHKEDALKIHAEIGKHIASGDHRALRTSMRELDNHISSKGTEDRADKVKYYADTLKDLKSRYGKASTKDALKRMRNESEDFTSDDAILILSELSESLAGDDLVTVAELVLEQFDEEFEKKDARVKKFAAQLSEIVRVQNPYGGQIKTQVDRDAAAAAAKRERNINRNSGDYEEGDKARIGAKSGTDTSSGSTTTKTSSYNNFLTKKFARPASQGKNQ